MHLHHRRRTLTLLAGTALTAAGLVGVTTPAAHAAQTLTVGNLANCPGVSYNTIGAAVTDAQPGDTIQVCAGVYSERVVVDKPDLTFVGATAARDPRKKLPKAQSVISNASGDFFLTAAADNTTITGFTLTGASDSAESGIDAFSGSSGLQVTNNLIQNNGNGLRLANPDGSKPALISTNNFIDNAANYATYGGQQGTGIFISSGPANSTRIASNAFRGHPETAINFAGDANNPSVNLVVTSNRSTDDSTFVVATNSSGAVIDHNIVTTDDDNIIGGHGTGILDGGGSSNLRITNNKLTANSPMSESSGVSVSNSFAANSTFTTVVGNTITGYYNDLKVVSGNRTASILSNKLVGAVNDGIVVQDDVSGVLFSRNVVTGAGLYSCQDVTTGSGTAGTANTWTKNRADTPSTPAAICPSR